MKSFIFTEERLPNRMRNNRRLRIYRVVKKYTQLFRLFGLYNGQHYGC